MFTDWHGKKQPDRAGWYRGGKFDITSVKQPIRDYLMLCGWKKAELFE